MSVIIRLQNLAWSANANDIRDFFKGLTIPEGGVHIVGGEMGDAFIAFATDEDARLAMMKGGESLKSVQITLQLSSRTQMQKVIETARQQALGLQSYVPTQQQAPSTPSQPQQPQHSQPYQQSSANPSALTTTTTTTPNQMMPAQQHQQPHAPLQHHMAMDQPDPNQQAPNMYKNQPGATPPAFGNPFGNQMPIQYPGNAYQPNSHMQSQGHFQQDSQFPKMQMPMQPMNQMSGQYYGQQHVLPNQMGRPMGRLPDQDMTLSQSPLPQNFPVNANVPHGFDNNSTASGVSTKSSAPAAPSDRRDKNSQSTGSSRNDKRDRDQKDDGRKKRSTSRTRSRSRERERRRRHRSRSNSRNRDRGSRRRRSRSHERERNRDREQREKERERREKDRNRNHKERIEPSQETPEPKPAPKPDNSGGIPGLGEIPDDIPKEGLSIFSNAGNSLQTPQVSQNDAGWPTKNNDSVLTDKSCDMDIELPDVSPYKPSSPTIPEPMKPMPERFSGLQTNSLPPNSAPRRSFDREGHPMNVYPPRHNEPAMQSFSASRDYPNPNDDGRMEFGDMQNRPPNWQDDRPMLSDNSRPSRFSDNWNEIERAPEQRPSKWDQGENDNRDLPAPEMERWSREPGPRSIQQPPASMDNNYGPDFYGRGARGGRGGFSLDRRSNCMEDFNNDPAAGPKGVRPVERPGRSEDMYGQDPNPYDFDRDRHDSPQNLRGMGRGWGRGRGARTLPGPDGRERKQKSCSIEILNVPVNAGYKMIREVFEGIFITKDSIKIVANEQGTRLGIALMRFSNTYDTYEAFKRSGSLIFANKIEINFIDDAVYDNAFDSGRADFSNRPRNMDGRLNEQQKPSACVFITGLPPYCKDLDIKNFLHEFAINFTEVVIEFDPQKRHATGGCFVRLVSPDETRFALRRVFGAFFGDCKLKVEICPEDAVNQYCIDREKESNNRNPPSFDIESNPHTENEKPADLTCLYIKDLPFGSTELDVENLLRDHSVGATEIVLQLERGSRQPTGGFFVRFSPNEPPKEGLRKLSGTKLESRIVKVELCSEEVLNKAIKDNEKLKIFARKVQINSAPNFQEKGNSEGNRTSQAQTRNVSKKPSNQKLNTLDIKGDLKNSPNHSEDQGKKVKNAPPSTFGCELLTDSVVLKNVSKEVSSANIRDFFSDEGLVPEAIHFNPTSSVGKTDVYVVFPLIENAKKALSKNNQQLGTSKVTVELICKPTVMSAMGKNFNPLELFQKGQKEVPIVNKTPGVSLASLAEKRKPILPNPMKEDLNTPKGDSYPERQRADDSKPTSRFNDSRREQRGFGGPRRGGIGGRMGERNIPREDQFPPRGQAQIGTPVTPDAFGRRGCVLALSNVPYSASTDNILSFFKDFPDLAPESIIRRFDERNRPTADARVSFNTPDDAIRAIKTLNCTFIMNRPIYLSLVN